MCLGRPQCRGYLDVESVSTVAVEEDIPQVHWMYVGACIELKKNEWRCVAHVVTRRHVVRDCILGVMGDKVKLLEDKTRMR